MSDSIGEPGVYFDIPMAQYLALDALSSTPLRKIVDECPRAAWFCSRMNPERPLRDESTEMDIGSIAHEILLKQSTDCLVLINPEEHRAKPKKVGGEPGAIPKGWTNESIRAARDAAHDAGKSPVLPKHMASIKAMMLETASYIDSIREHEPGVWRMFQPDGGASEVTLVWREGETLCKIRVDRASNDFRVIGEYKTSGMSVEPERFARTQFVGAMGYAFNAAWYRRGVRACTGVDANVVFLAQETAAPYLCSMPGLDPAWVAHGGAKVALALRMWQECARSGVWPGYPPRICYPPLPAWESTRLEEAMIEHGIPFDYAALTGRETPDFLKDGYADPK